MKAGDVLVSHPTAVREHEISVIPDAPHAVSPTHDESVNAGRSEADALGVDGWLTEDYTHVVKVASHRRSDDHGARTSSQRAFNFLRPGFGRPPSSSGGTCRVPSSSAPRCKAARHGVLAVGPLPAQSNKRRSRPS